MHAIEFTEDKRFGEVFFVAGARYLVEDHNAAQFMIQGGAKVFHQDSPPDLDGSQDWNGQQIHIVRCGAFGDLLMLTPILRELKRRWPTCEIKVSCFPRYRGVLENNPHIDVFGDYPVVMPLRGHTALVWLENAVETHPDARMMPIIDALSRRFGLIGLPDYSLEWNLSYEAKALATSYPRTGKKRVGVQTRASAPYKSYPQEMMDKAMMLLFQHGWEVFVFGSPGEVNIASRPGIVNVTEIAKTPGESAAIASTCDVILCPDSFFVHLAAAMDIPCVALYGPFPAELYTAHYSKCRPLQGQGACSPCFHHPRGTHYPTTGPCWRTGRCEVLADISPRSVVRAVEELYEETKH